MDARSVLAANLQHLKEVSQLSNLKLANKCGVSNGTIGRALLKQVALDIDSISAIAQAFGLEPWQILTPNLDIKHPPVVTLMTKSERDLYERLASVLQSSKSEQ